MFHFVLLEKCSDFTSKMFLARKLRCLMFWNVFSYQAIIDIFTHIFEKVK